MSHLSLGPMFRSEVCAAIRDDLVTQSIPPPAPPAGEVLPQRQLIVVVRSAAPPTVQGEKGKMSWQEEASYAAIASDYNFML